MAIFQRLNHEAGMTMIVVTHEPDIAAYAQRNMHFRDGRAVTRPGRAEPAQRAEKNW